MTTNTINDAASYFRPLIDQLLQGCVKAGVPCRIVDISRSPSQQVQKVKDGLSWTLNSKHLPQPPENKSEAVDIVPLVILGEHKLDWDPTNNAWQIIGEVGKSLGLRWGGDWKHINNGNGDPSHFEYVHPEAVPEDTTSTT
jgi:D-alanyl-D-alanine carboxypeptidase